MPEIRKYEAEYWEVLTQEARTCVVEEVEAQNAIIENNIRGILSDVSRDTNTY